jgi:hypothetical protein
MEPRRHRLRPKDTIRAYAKRLGVALLLRPTICAGTRADGAPLCPAGTQHSARPFPSPLAADTLQARVGALQEEHARATVANALGVTRAHVLCALLACHRVAAVMLAGWGAAEPLSPLDPDVAAMEDAAAALLARVHGGCGGGGAGSGREGCARGGAGGGGGCGGNGAVDRLKRFSGVGSTSLALCNRCACFAGRPNAAGCGRGCVQGPAARP